MERRAFSCSEAGRKWEVMGGDDQGVGNPLNTDHTLTLYSLPCGPKDEQDTIPVLSFLKHSLHLNELLDT